MSKYRKKAIVVDAKLFEMGMEDGYACYPLFSDKVLGYYRKGEAVPKAVRKPIIETADGWCEVEEGKHYIVNCLEGGERDVINKNIFEKEYEPVDKASPNHAIIRTEDWSHSCGDPGCCYEYGIDLYVNDILITNYFEGDEEDLQDILKLFGITSEIECE